MTWIKWENEIINLSKIAHISQVRESISGHNKGNLEIRLNGPTGRCVLLKEFHSRHQAEKALNKLEEDLIKHNYETGGR